jgi:Anthrone oxygenase
VRLLDKAKFGRAALIKIEPVWLGIESNLLEVIPMILPLIAILVLGLMCGSEINVAAFGHPTLNRQPLEAHIRVRSSLAALLARVMPVWMSASTLLNVLLLLPFAHLSNPAWRYAAIALAIQVAAVVFSLVAPVPINNRIARWTPESLPNDWRDQEHRWDLYHWFRTAGLVAAFAILAVSIAVR